MSLNINVEYKDKLFDGLFNYSFYNLSPNFLLNKLNVTASSTRAGYGQPSDAINPFKDIVWHSENVKNSSIVISLIGFQFNPSSYSLKARNDNENHFPVNWAFEGSNDGNKWTTIDAPGYNTYINSIGKEHHYDIKKNPNQYFRFLKFVGIQITKDNYFILRKIELFGSMIISLSSLKMKQTIECTKGNFLGTYLFIILSN